MKPGQYAAQLRLLKNFLGVLLHHRFNEFSGISKPEIRRAILGLYRITGITWRDLLGYARAGRRDIAVWDTPSGPRFRFRSDDASAHYGERE